MSSIGRFVLVGFVSLVSPLVGCRGDMGKAVLELTETYAAAACACKDAPCGKAAEAEYSKAMRDLSTKNAGRETGITDAEQKRVAETHTRAVSCRVKLDTPTPSP